VSDPFDTVLHPGGGSEACLVMPPGRHLIETTKAKAERGNV